MSYSKSNGCAYCDFGYYSVIPMRERPSERSSIIAGFRNDLSESLYFTQTHWTMECEFFFTIMTYYKFHCMKIKNGTGEILNWSKAFGKWNQILRIQKLLANHQRLPWFMMHLPVYLKTNKMMFWAVESLWLRPWASVLDQRNEESISIMKTKSNLFLCWSCLLCVRVTFFCEADFINVD